IQLTSAARFAPTPGNAVPPTDLADASLECVPSAVQVRRRRRWLSVQRAQVKEMFLSAGPLSQVCTFPPDDEVLRRHRTMSLGLCEFSHETGGGSLRSVNSNALVARGYRGVRFPPR